MKIGDRRVILVKGVDSDHSWFTDDFPDDCPFGENLIFLGKEMTKGKDLHYVRCSDFKDLSVLIPTHTVFVGELIAFVTKKEGYTCDYRPSGCAWMVWKPVFKDEQ